MSAPSVGSVLWRDFLASALARVGVGVWGFVVAFEAIGRLGGEQAATIHAWGAGNLLALAAMGSAVAIPLMVWRTVVIRRTFASGTPVRGAVVAAESHPNLRAVWVEYRVGGETYRRRNAVRHSGRPMPKIGDDVTVVVDPSDPNVGFVRELYLD
jgi:hypothetical protein